MCGLRCVLLCLFLVGSQVAFANGPQHQSQHAAELVIQHAAIYTMSSARTWAEALAIANGRLVYVGTDAGVAQWIGPKTHVVDAGGRFVLPGFHDCHVHPVSGGMELEECDLNDAKTAEQALAIVRDYAQKHPTAPWIRGSGWQLPLFPNANPS